MGFKDNRCQIRLFRESYSSFIASGSKNTLFWKRKRSLFLFFFNYNGRNIMWYLQPAILVVVQQQFHDYIFKRFFWIFIQKKSTLPSGNAGFYTLYNDLSRKKIICFSQKIIHYEAKLCILCIVSGFRDKDAPFVLLLFFHFLQSFRQNFNMFKDLSMESRNKQTQNCAPIQCTVWPRNVSGLLCLLSKLAKDVEYKT